MKMIERIIFFAVALLFANACLAYNPIIDGALVDLMIKVVDDRGETVSGAKVEVVIYTAPQKTEVKRGETDGKGLFAAKGRSYGEVEVYASKDGYYDTHTGAKFRTLSDK